MPYVNVPNDLSKIKTKIAFNLTKRQLICFGLGAAIGVPTYLLTRQAIGNTGALFAIDAAEDYGDDYNDTPPWEDEDETESEDEA